MARTGRLQGEVGEGSEKGELGSHLLGWCQCRRCHQPAGGPQASQSLIACPVNRDLWVQNVHGALLCTGAAVDTAEEMAEKRRWMTSKRHKTWRWRQQFQ